MRIFLVALLVAVVASTRPVKRATVQVDTLDTVTANIASNIGKPKYEDPQTTVPAMLTHIQKHQQVKHTISEPQPILTEPKLPAVIEPKLPAVIEPKLPAVIEPIAKLIAMLDEPIAGIEVIDTPTTALDEPTATEPAGTPVPN